MLLVEDDDDVATRVTDALGSSGDGWPDHDVTRVSDLRGAIDALEASDEIDCVLLDVTLPDATGMQAVDRLQLSHPTLPLVVLTEGHTEVSRLALRRGAQDFLDTRHDLQPELLARTVHHAIERAGAHRAVIESNQALAGFARMVAHDLRSPLAIATGMLELLERKAEGELDDDLLHLVHRSIAAISRAGDLVQALLDYARAKRPDDTREPVDLHEAATWAAAAAGVQQAGGSITVSHALPTVTAGEGAMRQVFQNLIGNAVRYADPDRALHVDVTAEEADAHWVIRVTDNGPGIPASAHEAVFDEGERLDQAGDGFGLGLPAVRATLDRYGGSVWVEDAPDGPGTTVAFTFPR